MDESMQLQCVPPGLLAVVPKGAKAVIEWALQLEWDHHKRMGEILSYRVNYQRWKDEELSVELRFLLSHRLRTVAAQGEILDMMKTPVPASMENLLLELGLKRWDVMRYGSWLLFAGRVLSGPVKDPFDPPSWSQ